MVVVDDTDALVLDDIRKSYFTYSGEVPVLKGVSFRVKRGEFLGIMGSSGSGKSTLLNTLGLLDTPTSGSYFLDGKEIGVVTPEITTSTAGKENSGKSHSKQPNAMPITKKNNSKE